MPGGRDVSRFGGGGGGSQLPFDEGGGVILPGRMLAGGGCGGGGEESGRALASAAAPVPFEGGARDEGGCDSGPSALGRCDEGGAGASDHPVSTPAGIEGIEAFGASLTNFRVVRGSGGGTGTGATASMPRGNVPRRGSPGGEDAEGGAAGTAFCEG